MTKRQTTEDESAAYKAGTSSTSVTSVQRTRHSCVRASVRASLRRVWLLLITHSTYRYVVYRVSGSTYITSS
jgi:hypothetical protein